MRDHRRVDISVAELAHAFWQHAKVQYARGRRRGAGEANHFKPVIRRLREMYEAMLANDFGPLSEAWRSHAGELAASWSGSRS